MWLGEGRGRPGLLCLKFSLVFDNTLKNGMFEQVLDDMLVDDTWFKSGEIGDKRAMMPASIRMMACVTV
jgi:hypothetical protein